MTIKHAPGPGEVNRDVIADALGLACVIVVCIIAGLAAFALQP